MHQNNHVDKKVVGTILESLGYETIPEAPVDLPSKKENEDETCFVFEHNGEDYMLTEEVVEVDSELYVRVQKVDIVNEEVPTSQASLDQSQDHIAKHGTDA